MADHARTRPTSFRFTAAALTALAPGARRYTVFDVALPAFGLRVEPSGRKTFQLTYRHHGHLRAATLGRLGVVTLQEARDHARRMLGDLATGVDPLARRDAERAALSVREAADRWLRDHVAARRKPTTLRLYRLALDQHVYPKLGALPITDLSTAHVVALHQRLKATPTMANRVVAVVSSLCSWCERQRLRPPHSNPCTDKLVERYTERHRTRYLSLAEYGRLGTALRAAERDQSANPLALRAIRLLLLTGCRPSEITGLRWSEVNLRAGLLQLADSKTGAKVVHLPAEAIRLLRAAPRFEGSEFVFPGTGRRVVGRHLVNLADAWGVLRTAAKLDGVRLYDAVRHSFASVAISSHGQPLSVIGELLAHTQASTTKRYSHLHDDTARNAAHEIGGTIAAALRKRSRKATK